MVRKACRSAPCSGGVPLTHAVAVQTPTPTSNMSPLPGLPRRVPALEAATSGSEAPPAAAMNTLRLPSTADRRNRLHPLRAAAPPVRRWQRGELLGQG